MDEPPLIPTLLHSEKESEAIAHTMGVAKEIGLHLQVFTEHLVWLIALRGPQRFELQPRHNS